MATLEEILAADDSDDDLDLSLGLAPHLLAESVRADDGRGGSRLTGGSTAAANMIMSASTDQLLLESILQEDDDEDDIVLGGVSLSVGSTTAAAAAIVPGMSAGGLSAIDTSNNTGQHHAVLSPGALQRHSSHDYNLLQQILDEDNDIDSPIGATKKQATTSASAHVDNNLITKTADDGDETTMTVSNEVAMDGRNGAKDPYVEEGTPTRVSRVDAVAIDNISALSSRSVDDSIENIDVDDIIRDFEERGGSVSPIHDGGSASTSSSSNSGAASFARATSRSTTSSAKVKTNRAVPSPSLTSEARKRADPKSQNRVSANHRLHTAKSGDAEEITLLELVEAQEQKLVSSGNKTMVSPLQIKRRMKELERERVQRARLLKMEQGQGSNLGASMNNSELLRDYGHEVGVIRVDKMVKISKQLKRNSEFSKQGPGLPKSIAIHSKFIAIGTQWSSSTRVTLS